MFYTNVAKITEYGTNKFTKYGLSRPDVSSYISGVISTKDHTRTVFLSSTAESLDLVQNLSLTAEGNTVRSHKW